MTDMSTNYPIRRSISQRLSIPASRIAASLAAMSAVCGDAFKMAYVEPYSHDRRPQVLPDDDLEGRDPTW